MNWLWIGLAILASIGLLVGLFWLGVFLHIRQKYLGVIIRIFQEPPLFIIPRGQPVPDAEEVNFPSENCLSLRGCYLRTRARQRRGVILFGLEFGSNRWSCVPYCTHLLEAGYDVFSFEPRNQGDSPRQPGYDPLPWVTDYEVRDFQAALEYLKGRGDADPRGVGLFGISKGGVTAILAAIHDPYVRCVVTDGMFATFSTMVPYMQKWISIYSDRYRIQAILPRWIYALFGWLAIRHVSRIRNCQYLHLEPAIGKLAPRPLLMIHGGSDTYIKPDMAESLFARARQPKEFWMVPGAKHNLALHVAREEYCRRVLEFFHRHLAAPAQPDPECDKAPASPPEVAVTA